MICITKTRTLGDLRENLQRQEEQTRELQNRLREKEALLEDVSRSCASHDLVGMAEVLCRTFAEQADKSRDLEAERCRRLMAGLEHGRRKIETLQIFLSIAMRHIGRLEGLSLHSEEITLKPEHSRDLITAAQNYQNSLQP